MERGGNKFSTKVFDIMGEFLQRSSPSGLSPQKVQFIVERHSKEVYCAG